MKNTFIFKLPNKELPKGIPIDWSKYLPAGEPQKYTFDEDDCMTFSATHTVATMLNYMMANGLLPQDFLTFCQKNGYIVNNSFEFSVRFNAIMNGTNPAVGADFATVWDGMANYGMIPSAMLSYSMAEAELDATELAEWDDYYNIIDVTQAMKDLANQFNQFISIKYDWILSSGFMTGLWNKVTGQTQTSILQGALLTTPVHQAMAACPTWNTGQVQWCGSLVPEHGVMNCYTNNDTSMNIMDQYFPWLKVLEAGYEIPYAVVPVITFKTKPVHVFNVNMAFGDTSAEVTWLQRCLAYLGLFSIAPTGYYGSITAQAVLKFQTAQGINPTSESNVGPKSRLALNTLFSGSTGV